MTSQRRAQLVTILVLVAVVAVIAIRQTGWKPSGSPAPDTTPQDVIYGMLDAAREGDVDTYLDAFTGQIRSTLEQAITEKGDDAFAEYLRNSNAPVKGIAITEPEQLSPGEVRARVEFVFQDRNEVQFMHLRRDGGRWFITRLDNAQRIETLVPYGTPVQ